MPFDETDILLIVALALGRTQGDAGKFAATLDHPQGISERSVRERIKKDPDAYERLTSLISSEVTYKTQVEIEELTKEKYVEKRGKLRGKALVVKEMALNAAILRSSDIDALTLGNRVADAIEDRDFGKAKEIKEVNTRADVVVWHAEKVSKLTRDELEMRESADLLKMLPSGVIDAEFEDVTQ